MDSQERHELKENELAEFFKNFGEKWERFSTPVLVVLVIVAGTYAGFQLWGWYQETRHETAWTEFADAQTPEALIGVAENYQYAGVPVLAYLRAGDLYLARAIEGYQPPLSTQAVELDGVDELLNGEDADAPTGSEHDRGTSLTAARAAYERVLELSTQAVPRANALMGLAAVAETQGEWEQASDYYAQVQELAAEILPGIASQASRRQAMIEQLRQPVVFAPDSAVPEQDDFDFDFDSLFDFTNSDAELPEDAQPGDGPTLEGEPVLPGDADMPTFDFGPEGEEGPALPEVPGEAFDEQPLAPTEPADDDQPEFDAPELNLNGSTD